MPGDDETEVKFRWGHSEGITAIDILDGDGEKLITCGADGDLRVWKGFDDEDPEAHALSDNGLTLVCGKDNDVYVGTEYNTVEALNLEDGRNLGVKAKFTGHVNHVDLSKDGKWLVAGSADTKIQLLNLEDSSVQPVTIETHSAPVLSVALDPLKSFLATSGCDGNVCVWSLTDEGRPVHMVKKLESVFPASNDIETSSTLCRIAWECEGKILAVPEEDHVALYARESWAKLKVLKPQKSQKIASVVKFSKCSSYLAAGGSDGSLLVWSVDDSKLLAERAEFSDQITGIVFANNGSDIFATDCKGRVLHLKDFKTQMIRKDAPAAVVSNVKETSKEIDSDQVDDTSQEPKDTEEADNFNNGFEDDSDDDLFAAVGDDDNEISISKIKADTGFVDDEYVGVDKARLIIGGDLSDKKDDKSDDDNDDAMSVVSSINPSRPRSRTRTYNYPPQKIVIPFTEPQKPFQPASSPVHLDHKFMIWNNTGIIRNYKLDDDENQTFIDIEFHDAAVHHAIHLKNQHDFQLATLTKEMAVFSNEKQSDAGSKLFCYSFGAWDSKKEWSTDLPTGEEIIGLAAGDGWIAASTDMNRIRLFTTGGVQKQIIDLGGQIITTTGFEELLFVAFHNGIGLHGNQCIAYSIFRIQPTKKPFPLVSCEPLPISPKSQISWMGFSDEGTPLCSDSHNILRILSGRYWTTLCSLKEHLHAGSGSSDHFWVVGVSELDQRIRAVKCRGMMYPPTLPRPVLMQLDAQMPLCEMDTEKSRLEDRFHRSLMLDALSKKMDKKNYEVDDIKSKAEKELKETLFNLFVMSCGGGWDARGTEYASMMPSAHAVQVAVKYASKLRKKGLVDRLTALGRKKLDQEELEDEGDDDDFETVKIGTMVYASSRIVESDYSDRHDMFSEANSSRHSSSFSTSFSTGNRSITTVPDEENPFMKKNTDDIRKVLGSTSILDSSSSNRFRKSQNNSKDAGTSAEGGKGLSMIDSWKKPSEKPAELFSKSSGITRNTRGGGRKGAADKEKGKEKEQAVNKDKKKQPTLLELGGRKRNASGANPESPAAVVDLLEESNDAMSVENQECDTADPKDPSERNSESLLEDSTNTRHEEKAPPVKKQGYMLWFDENKDMLELENPDIDAKELTKIAMQMFKKLSPEEKKKYSNPSYGQNEEKKRKRSEIEDDVEVSNANGSSEGEKKSRLTGKLAAFRRSNVD